MHELGIVFHIIKTVEDVAKENKVSQVKSVTLQIGEVSSIVNSYLEDCWKWAVEKSELMKGCKLNIEPIVAITICEDCHKEYPTVKFGRECPYCHSYKTHLLKGTEVNIKEIGVI